MTEHFSYFHKEVANHGQYDITDTASPATMKSGRTKLLFMLFVNIKFCVGPLEPKEVYILEPPGRPTNAEEEICHYNNGHDNLLKSFSTAEGC